MHKTHLLILAIVLLGSCNNKSDPKAISPSELPVIEIVKQDIPIYSEYVAQVYGAKDIAVRARVEGFLQEIHFNEGKQVKEGDLIYVIESLPYKAKVNTQKSRLAEAITRSTKAKNDLERIKPLVISNAVSEAEYDAAKSNYYAAESVVQAERANLEAVEIELSYTRIKAPISGIIGRTLADVGDFVGREPNPVILNTISQTGDVKLQFSLTETEYLSIVKTVGILVSEGMDEKEVRNRFQNKLQLILADGSLYEHTGSVDFIDRGIDANTGTILVQANFPNPDLMLRPGMTAKIRAKRTLSDGIMVPQRCVMELQGQYSVYVVTDSNTVAKRNIGTAQTVGDFWVITEGLSAGDQVVLEGLQRLRPGSKIKPHLTTFESQAKLEEDGR